MATMGVARRVLAVGAVAAATLLVPGGPVGGQAAGCAPPYLPIFGFTTAPSQADPPMVQVYPEAPVQAPSLDGEDRTYDTFADPDMDGDGQPDALDGANGAVTITRGDGVLTLSQPGLVLSPTASFRGADLDADGREEAYVLGRPASGEDRYFVIPGTTPVGAQVAADVGIEVPAGIGSEAGDQIDGPGDDLLVAAGASGVLTSGDAVMAPGPGGTLAAFEAGSPPFDQGQPAGALVLDDGPPVLVFTRTEGDHTVISLWDEGTTTEYRTVATSAGGTFQIPRVTAVATATGVRLVASETTRSGTLSFVWDLDDPCATLSPAAGDTPPPVPGSAPGAQPVRGNATYTG